MLHPVNDLQKYITNRAFLCDKFQTLLKTHVSLPSRPEKNLSSPKFSTSVCQCLFNMWSSDSIWLLFSFKWAVYQVLWVCLGFFPFIFKTASDPVLITIMSQSCIMRPDLSQTFWFDFQSSLGLHLVHPYHFSKSFHFQEASFFMCSPRSISYHKWNDLHMGPVIPSMQNDWGKFRRQISWNKNLKCMWSTKYHKICLCKLNSFQTLLEIPLLMSEANYL